MINALFILEEVGSPRFSVVTDMFLENFPTTKRRDHDQEQDKNNNDSFSAVFLSND